MKDKDAGLAADLLSRFPLKDGTVASGGASVASGLLRRTSGGVFLIVEVASGTAGTAGSGDSSLEEWRARLETELRRCLPEEERASARVVLTSSREGGASGSETSGGSPVVSSVGSSGVSPVGSSGRKAATRHQEAGPLVSGIRHIVAIGSGKGGVGKSTVSVNLALGLSRGGWRVGLLDADIYGPSQSLMLDLRGGAEVEDGQIIPGESGGIKVVSMGQLAPDGRAAIWRGPMIQSALVQLLGQVLWGELDCLVVDLPPGTGDIPLTLSQRVELSGAVLVSTPQEVSLLDVRKACGMFRRLSVPLLGVVENMSGYGCMHCGEMSYPFGRGLVREWGEAEGIPFLGEVPLDGFIRESGDAGAPVMVAEPEGILGGLFMEMAARLRTRLED